MVGAGKGFEGFDQLIKWVAVGIEAIAIGIIVVGAITTTIIFLVRIMKRGPWKIVIGDSGAISARPSCWVWNFSLLPISSARWRLAPPIRSGDIGAFGSNSNLSEFFPGIGESPAAGPGNIGTQWPARRIRNSTGAPFKLTPA